MNKIKFAEEITDLAKQLIDDDKLREDFFLELQAQIQKREKKLKEIKESIAKALK